jgi:hypothetical protein
MTWQGSDTAGLMKNALKPIMDAILLGEEHAEVETLAWEVAARFSAMPLASTPRANGTLD